MKKLILLFFISTITCKLFGQQYVGIRFSNNVNALPVTGIPKVFYTAFHPGLHLTLDGRLNTKTKNQFRNELNLGGIYHRHFQLGIQLIDILKYQFSFSGRFGAFAGVGIGYMHSFYQYEIFQLNKNADYEKISGWKGRPQMMGILALGTHIGLLKNDPELIRLNIEFRSWIHGVFASTYVPAVPYNSIWIGLSYRWKKSPASNTVEPATTTQQ